MIRHFVKMTASNTRLIKRRGEEKPLRLGLMVHGLLFMALVSGSAHSARAELISQRLDANVAVMLNGTPFASVLIPNALPGGDDMFELIVGNQIFQLLSGQEFNFTTINSDGVCKFGIRGISVAEQLDPNDPLAFATGLSFIEAGAVSSFQMTAVTSESVVREPTSLALFGFGTSGMVVFSNRRRKSQGQ